MAYLERRGIPASGYQPFSRVRSGPPKFIVQVPFEYLAEAQAALAAR